MCVENCPAYPWYPHYNKFGDSGNELIQVYFYNHISRLVVKADLIMIPTTYPRMEYFKRNYDKIGPDQNRSWDERRFCLIATRLNNLRKVELVTQLRKMGECDLLQDFHTSIHDKSCYNSIELLNLMNRYQFVFVSENSIADGYITEKIFNVFFARSVPIYSGSPKILDQNVFYLPI